jgi:hypothetical protein
LNHRRRCKNLDLEIIIVALSISQKKVIVALSISNIKFHAIRQFSRLSSVFPFYSYKISSNHHKELVLSAIDNL